MAVSNVQSPNTGAAAFDLSLKIFSGMILAEFDDLVHTMDKHRVGEMEAGADSVQFPALGQVGVSYHTPGESVLTDADADGADYLKTFNQGERLIYADRELLTSVFIDKIEERIAKPAWRAEYSKKMATALALHADEMVMRTIAKCALETTATYTGGPVGGGNVVDAMTVPGNIVDVLTDASVQFDENNVPQNDRYAFLTPQTIANLVRDTEGRAYINRDYESSNGSLAKGIIGEIAGFKIVKVNSLPQGAGPAAAVSGLTGTKSNDYSLDLSGGASTLLTALIFQSECIGTARSVGIRAESEYRMDYRADHLIASYAMGHGILRPECAIAVTTVALP